MFGTYTWKSEANERALKHTHTHVHSRNNRYGVLRCIGLSLGSRYQQFVFINLTHSGRWCRESYKVQQWKETVDNRLPDGKWCGLIHKMLHDEKFTLLFFTVFATIVLSTLCVLITHTHIKKKISFFFSLHSVVFFCSLAHLQSPCSDFNVAMLCLLPSFKIH